jgi:HEAT repeat protein
VEAAAQRLSDRDPAVAAEAARVLGGLGQAAAPALPRLRETLHAGDQGVRAAAAAALGELRLEPDAVVQDLCFLLDETDDGVFAAAATALGRFAAPIDEVSLMRLLARLDLAFAQGRDYVVVAVARALLAITEDPERCVREHFSGNAEWCRLALTALKESREDKELGSWPRPSETASESE